MDAERISIAEACLHAAHDGSLSFPEIMNKLIEAGFEGYLVDYRHNIQIYYLPDGDSSEFNLHPSEGTVAADFNVADVEEQVHEAQANGSGYTYKRFCEKVKTFGCAGYLVSFLGRRVVYFGRTGDTHVEHFPI